jgi:hypothetical protein
MQMSNVPAPSSGGSKPFFQVWIDALTKPNEQTFVEIASSPNAKAMTAYIWVFVGYLIEFFLSALVSAGKYATMLGQYGLGQGSSGGLGGGGIVTTLIFAICGGPILAVVATIFFAVWTALIQWVAKRFFGGTGTNDQLAYAFAAILTPFAVISGVVTLFTAIPFVGLCFSAILAIAGIYVAVLNVMAAKAVNQFGWGQAVGSVFIPGLALGLVCCCVVFGISAVAGTGLKGILQQLQQSGGSGQ